MKRIATTCTLDGCDRPHLSRGWCSLHLRRVLKTGDPGPVEAVGQPPGEQHHNWTATPTYGGAHIRVRRVRGSATAHTCGCGRPARTWAYDHLDPNELTEEQTTRAGAVITVAYSADPAHYMAMCVRCHRVLDHVIACMRTGMPLGTPTRGRRRVPAPGVARAS